MYASLTIIFITRRNILIVKRLEHINLMKDKFLSTKILINGNKMRRSIKSQWNKKENHLKRLKNMNIFSIQKKRSLPLKKLYLKKSRENNLMKGLRAIIQRITNKRRSGNNLRSRLVKLLKIKVKIKMRKKNTIIMNLPLQINRANHDLI